MSETPKQLAKDNAVSVKDFFESIAPGRMVPVKEMSRTETNQYGISFRLELPLISLHNRVLQRCSLLPTDRLGKPSAQSADRALRHFPLPQLWGEQKDLCFLVISKRRPD